MQRIDKRAIREFGIPGLVLMENAGLGIVSLIKEKFPDLRRKKVLIIAGKGNNGGDGFVIARHLFNDGIDVTVLIVGKLSELQGDAGLNAETGRKVGIPLIEINEKRLSATDHLFRHSHIIVDAIFGTGLTRPAKGIFKKVIDKINKSGKYVLAVDIPSGLGSDSGITMAPYVQADLTASLALLKRSQMLFPAAEAMGELRVVDIGIPQAAIDKEKINVSLAEDDDIRGFFPKRRKASHKGDFGHLLVIAGSRGKGGAAGLAALAALRIGTGLVTLAIPDCCNAALEYNPMEVMTAPLPETKSGSMSLEALDVLLERTKNKTAVAIGPGITTHAQTVKLMQEYLVQLTCPVVIDADGLNCISRSKGLLKKIKCPLILTPHPKEMSRLSGLTTINIQSRRIETAKEFARKNALTVVLKGAGTVIACQDGRIFINPTGNSGLATAGTGDVLTGMIGGLLAQGMDMDKAAIAGTWLHGLAADDYAKDNSQTTLIASDLLSVLPKTMKRIML